MRPPFKNTFEKGLASDIDNQIIDPSSYIEAHNLILTQSNKFTGASDFQGTSLVGDVSGGITTNLQSNVKSIVGKYTIGIQTEVNCITYFITANQAGDQGAFYIVCRDLDNDVLYYLYRETGLGTDYFDQHRIVDVRKYAENGVDVLYFSDGWSEMRQLRCEIPAASPDYFLSAYDLSLQRRGANGTIVLTSITQTGTLLSGTYQYAYRMVDPSTKRLTKWSSLTSPFHVYQTADATNDPVYSAVGASTPFAINITITPTQEELDNFGHYQLAVVENIYPVTTSVQPASLLPIQSISGPSATFSHKANEKINLVPIEDLVVDLAAIKSVKTLGIKQNRLFGGNIKYHNFVFDNGVPSAGGSIISSHGTQADSFSDQGFSSTSVGYFRDEVYRFGIVYRDKYGNKAPVQPLDLSSIVDNQIAAGLKDLRFPGRNVSNSYTLFDNGGFLQSLGLGLTNIHNHPTWAVGFEIVRAKRIKKILFQTPMVPMVTVTGVGAFDDYPSQSTTTASSAHVAYPDAQPQINLPVYVPKNLFWPEIRNIRLRTQTTGGGATLAKIGEAVLTIRDKSGASIADPFYYSMIFPPSSMYGAATPYTFGNFEKLQTVDYCLSKAYITNMNATTGFDNGDQIRTRTAGTFTSIEDGAYFFDSGWVGKTIDSELTSVKNYVFQDNLSNGEVLSGNKIQQYSELNGVGIDWGYPPQVQRNAVIQTVKGLNDVNVIDPAGLDFAAGHLNLWDPGAAIQGFVVGASGPSYETDAQIHNKYIDTYAGFANGTNYTQFFRIVNVINDIGDERYGNFDDPHDFISTGASYSFTPSELLTVQAGGLVNVNLDVYGGDCFVAPHTFKVSDSWYSVVNQGKNNAPQAVDAAATLLDKWGGRFYFNHGTGAALCIPVAVEGASQFIQVILESEYNGGVMEQDIFDGTSNIGGIYINDLVTEGALRSPLTYHYNNNISKQNDQKVYFTKQPFSFEQFDFRARIAYSDLKIYNTDIQGFDVFRVGNVFDLEENKGALIKIALAGDSMYTVQETGVVYLPTNQNQLQQTDAGMLAVGTGDVIGRPIIIDQLRGSQHMNGIVETGVAIYLPDNINKNIYVLAAQQPLQSITQNRVDSLFGTLFDDIIDENLIIGVRDPFNKDVWFIDNFNNKCYVFSEKIAEGGAWQSNFEFYDSGDSESAKAVDGTAGNNRLYLTADKLVAGKSQLTAHTMYTGDFHSHFGTTKTPRITIVTNPDSDLSKVFDDQAFVATNRLASVDRIVERDSALGNQEDLNGDLDLPPVEGNYRNKTLRDSVGARLRGTKLNTTVYWKTGATDNSTLSSVLTKYRLSARTPF